MTNFIDVLESNKDSFQQQTITVILNMWFVTPLAILYRQNYLPL